MKTSIIINLVIALTFIALLPLHWWYIAFVCIPYPNAAFLPGIALLCISPLAYSCRNTKRIRSTVAVVVVGLAWLTYALWEHKVYQSIDPRDIPIRADLVLIIPLLWFGAGKVVEVLLSEMKWEGGQQANAAFRR